jgi:hypothetical protein
VNILNKFNSHTRRIGLCLAVGLLWSRGALAEITLVEKDGWEFSFDGRVNSFLSGGKGQDFPQPSANADGTPGTHQVMGSGAPGSGAGRPDVGWPAGYGQQDTKNNYVGIRARSGMYPNILAFGLSHKVGESTEIKAYVSLWSTIESLNRDKWSANVAEAREGYMRATGPWGSTTVGRQLGLFGRSSYEIDTAYGHGYGVGLPCTDTLGPACGHIGTGALAPGYSAGFVYATPSLGGLQLQVGIFDPVTLGSSWTLAPLVRQEAALTFRQNIGEKIKIRAAIEGLYQTLNRISTDTMGVKSTASTAVWGGAGALRLEAGPIRLGGAVFRGRGTGLNTVLAKTTATADDDSAHALPSGLTYELRTFTGYYAQSALVLGSVRLALGFGQALADQVAADKVNSGLSVIHSQTGASAGIFYELSDAVVIGLDYFHFIASWYGAPIVATDMTTGALTATGKLAGEKQVLDFLSAGVTYRW